MADRLSLKQLASVLLLVACLQQMPNRSLAASLFTGINDIQPLPLQGNTQPIRIVSDLPFEYQLIPLNTDQVLVRFLNARLSHRLQTPNGVLPIQTQHSAIHHAIVCISETPDIEEIILTGEGLGKRQIVIDGGQQVPVDPEEMPQPLSTSNTHMKVAASTSNSYTSKTTLPPELKTHNITRTNYRLQLPLEKQKSGTVEIAQEALPQPASARLPRPSFQPEVLADNIPVLQEGDMPNQTQSIMPALEPEHSIQQTAQPETVSTESNVELQKNLQSSYPGNNAINPLRPKDTVTAKPRLELALSEDNSANKHKTRHQESIRKPFSSIQLHPQSTRSLEVVSNKNKPIVHFPNITATVSQNTPEQIAAIQEEKQQRTQTSEVPITVNSTPFHTTESAYSTLAFSSPMQLQNSVETAKSQYAALHTETAETAIETALHQNPKNASLYAILGEMYVGQHRYTDAQIAYGQAFILANHKYALRYAQVLVLTHQRQQAIQVLEKLLAQKEALRNNPTEAGKTHYMLGTLYEEKGDTQTALPHLQQAAQYLPNDADIHYNLALAYELSGNLPLARAHYSKATQLNPSAQDAQQGLQRVKQF